MEHRDSRGQTRAHGRGNHMVYASTWYSLAAALVVVYMLLSMHED